MGRILLVKASDDGADRQDSQVSASQNRAGADG